MRTNIYRAITSLGLFFVLGASARAQSGAAIEAVVAFDFQAGKAQLPAGMYTVTQLSQDAMLLHSADGRNSVLIYTPLTQHARRNADSARLTFRRYGLSASSRRSG